jgi:TatD DNase family protein
MSLPYWIDTHCHLDATEFTDNRAEIHQAALRQHVKKIVVPAITASSFAQTRQTAQYPGCYQAYGLHPIFIATHQEQDLTILRTWLMQEKAVAVGEMGLDGFIPGLDQQKQLDFFYAQLKLACELDLPVILHIRKAQDAILKGLRRFRPKGGVAHAFNGSAQQAKMFINLGFKLGFGGTMTYTRALNIRRLASSLPLESIVLETDSPDIPPAFARDSPNQPAHIPRIAETLAALRQLSLADIARYTSRNAEAVFSFSSIPNK